jgi:hypothetical protein
MFEKIDKTVFESVKRFFNQNIMVPKLVRPSEKNRMHQFAENGNRRDEMIEISVTVFDLNLQN